MKKFSISFNSIIEIYNDFISMIYILLITLIGWAFFLPALYFLLLSVFGLLLEIVKWDKTGYWTTYTFHMIFLELGRPIQLFVMPEHLGIQNLINNILNSSSVKISFITSLILGWIGLKLYSPLDSLKEGVWRKYNSSKERDKASICS